VRSVLRVPLVKHKSADTCRVLVQHANSVGRESSRTGPDTAK
jgi:hypothetical protein